MRILVIEDDPDILANVAHHLGARGYIVDCACDGQQGYALAAAHDFDLIVLDVMLPRVDGLQLCRRLRGEDGRVTPIIMVTARDTLDERLQGFDAGADDYLVKPFALSELAARVKAILQRAHPAAMARVLHVGDLRLQTDTLQLSRAGQALRLPRRRCSCCSCSCAPVPPWCRALGWKRRSGAIRRPIATACAPTFTRFGTRSTSPIPRPCCTRCMASAIAWRTKMATDSRLSRHLVLTYLCLSVAIGAVLSVLSWWTVVKLEEHLQRIDMGMAVERVRGDFLAGKEIGRADRFFHGEPGSAAFPEWLRGIPAGFHKLQQAGRIWHAMADDHGGTRYVLLRDYTEYEHSQVRSHWVTVAALAASLLAAFGLGALASRRFVRPLLTLAEQVGLRPELPPRTRLAQAYPPNEIGQLAQAFDETYNQLEQALERERLFTADVSHELRTPLMVISSSAEVLDDTPDLPRAVRVQTVRIRKAATEMQQHLQTHLMLARGASSAKGFAQASAQEVVEEECQRWLPGPRPWDYGCNAAAVRGRPCNGLRRCCMSWSPT
ncbi:HAMP domain protein [Bordetella holmesii ATCC 51541]|nr:HAMP domain protein [Bordetella holmesii ATCC 51541]